ncbi:MAG: hypothetical protein H8Z69_02160 [Nanohaloarchaea archaeon]|nr:hypothetical protein [Candidatus Nanohaloarchaea archaeon]
MNSYDISRIEDIQVYVDDEPQSVLDMFDIVHEPVYELVEDLSDGGRSGNSYMASGSMGRNTNTGTRMKPDQKQLWEEYNEKRDELDVKLAVEPEEGPDEEFEIFFREDFDPEGIKQPPSAAYAVSDDNEYIGIRVARSYDTDLITRSSLDAGDLSNLQQVFGEGNYDVTNGQIENGEQGWIQEVGLRTALDRDEGVHDELGQIHPGLTRLTRPEQLWVDSKEPKTRNRGYEKSNLDVGILHSWSEPVDSMGISKNDAEMWGRHAATLNGLGLLGHIDRSAPEYLVEADGDGRYVFNPDLEFILYSDNDMRINGEDVNDMAHILGNAVRGSFDGEPDRDAIRNRPGQMKEERKRLLGEVNQEELRKLVPENVPEKWDEDLVRDEHSLMVW